MRRYKKLSYNGAGEMMFGRALHPLRCGFDLVIGAGEVFPEVNYTLPPMEVSPDKLPAILEQYREMVTSVLSRAQILGAPGVVLEFEHAPQMTGQVEIGVAITQQTRELMEEFYRTHGLRSALRATVCDIRDELRPPRMRSGQATETMLRSFADNARAGAHMLSIESTGGKEVHDRALLEGDVVGILFALGVLAPRDMHFLWGEIVRIAGETGTIPAGDTACGFANTAMVLADRHYLPAVLAAVVRAMSAVRSLVAFEQGAVGPSKDCAYEGPVMKAITGLPISMEGKSSACAHFSHMGNVAAAVCDLWSNESVQNVRLLSGSAPEVFTEVLLYDCRLFNQALAAKQEKVLQRLLVDSDVGRSVHALMVAPESAVAIARAIVAEDGDFQRTRQAGLAGCAVIREALSSGALQLVPRELDWLSRIEDELAACDSEDKATEHGFATYGELFAGEEYGLPA
ncbi:MAG: methyltransferase MtaB domain-containing protein [bacterium]|jgi:methanol--5-hydroxybenzimidazolylcobamide Co-methyltransferase|nr:hypothetical protein [candidate division KSB1 bacterium]MDH7560310.1 methyltransferase MtaB domain-containing protein [bacterium]